MNNNDPTVTVTRHNDRKNLLKDQVQKAIAAHNLEDQRRLVNAIAAELKTSVLECAAAIVYLNEQKSSRIFPDEALSGNTSQARRDKQDNKEKPLTQFDIRLVRYRLDLGNQHQVALDEIKKVLVEESGVDIKNITNVRILDTYTLIDLPDEMPQEIFHHLKTVEINGQKLDIRRVKPRNKKRGQRSRHQHARPGSTTASKEISQ
jgi:DbpA RNA binding domain